MSNLTHKSVHAIKWNAIGTIARFILQLIAQIILSRILGPSSYGLFGLGLIVYTFGNFFSSFGFGRQLIQKQNISDLDIRFAFTWQVLLGAIATVVIYICAGSISTYFKAPDLVPIIEWLSLACVINAATAPANNLLSRELRFKDIAKIQFISYFISYILIGVPLALYGLGVYALLIAWMSQLVFILVLTFLAHPHSLKPLLWYADADNAMSYGGTVFVTNIVNWMLTNIDRIVVGRFLSVHTVGLYTVSYNLATLPNSLLLNGLQTIFLASGAKTNGEIEKIRQSYAQIVSTILVLILPAFVFFSTISPLLMELLYGEKWAGSGDILAVMFLGVPAMIVWGLSTPVLWNMGKKHHEALLQVPVILLAAVLLYSYASQGAIAVAWFFVLIAYLRAAVMFYSAAQSLTLKSFQFLPSLIRGVFFSCLFYVTTNGVIMFADIFGSDVFSLLLSVISSLLIALVITLKCPNLLGADVIKMLARFHPRFNDHSK